jgi:hypothetical protein
MPGADTFRASVNFMSDAEAGVRELARVTKPGGVVASCVRWCGDGELAKLWRAAGLQNVHFGSFVVRARYADFEDLWSPLPKGIGPARAFCKSLVDERRAALREAYRRRLGVGDGPFELTARAWAVAGTP